jgi:lipopolysaccharide/colanic/teichoic acid biosynthesis glycosyltransferase
MASSAGLRIQLSIKRAADVAAAGILLVALAPLMAVIALVVKATSEGEVVFRQQRVGRAGRPFTILKFRTMAKDAPRSPLGTYCYKDDPRVTRVGRLLRRSSLDELPQLVNILRGDMSIVGPRPDLPHHVARYTPFQRQRLEMRPGVTGWAQVNGRNSISWEERIRLDVEYVRGWSALRDLQVVLRTIAVVLTGRGAELPGKLGGARWESKTPTR